MPGMDTHFVASLPEGCRAFPSLQRRSARAVVARPRDDGPKRYARRCVPRVSAAAGLPPVSATSAVGLGAAGLPGAAPGGPISAPAVPTPLGPGGVSAPVPDVAAAAVLLPDSAIPMESDAGNERGFKGLWAKYNRLLEEKPIMVKSMTSLFGFMIGDICAQAICGGGYDPLRTARLTAFGVLMDGPVGHCWYTFLDKNVMPDDPKSAKAIVSKMAMDQLLWAPMFCCVFFTFVRTLEGHPWQALSTIQSELVPTILANYALWPLAHIINFRFVPSQQRILYINFVQVLWTCYLSNLAANGHGHMLHH